MYSECRAACERLGFLQRDLTRLKRELAEAWASPEHGAQVPVIEHRIRGVWEQMDRLAVSLSEPMTRGN